MSATSNLFADDPLVSLQNTGMILHLTHSEIESTAKRIEMDPRLFGNARVDLGTDRRHR